MMKSEREAEREIESAKEDPEEYRTNERRCDSNCDVCLISLELHHANAPHSLMALRVCSSHQATCSDIRCQRVCAWDYAGTEKPKNKKGHFSSFFFFHFRWHFFSGSILCALPVTGVSSLSLLLSLSSIYLFRVNEWNFSWKLFRDNQTCRLESSWLATVSRTYISLLEAEIPKSDAHTYRLQSIGQPNGSIYSHNLIYIYSSFFSFGFSSFCSFRREDGCAVRARPTQHHIKTG